MRARVLLLLLLAAGAGLGTIQFVRQWLAAQQVAVVEVQPNVPPPTTHVLVAAAELSAGTFVAAEDLRWQSWPDETLTPGYIVEGTQSAADLVGAVVRSRLTAGEPVTAGKLVRPGDRGFLAAVLNPGMRAIAVPVTETTGIAGLIFPGDRVDVILSVGVQSQDPGSNAAHRAGETVLTDLRVLAVNQSLEDRPGEPQVGRTVTLEVTPREAEKIAVMLELGSIALTLRSLAEPDPGATVAVETAGTAADPSVAPPDGAAPRQVYTLDTDVARALRRRPTAAPQPQAPPGPEVAVVRGSSSRGGPAPAVPGAPGGGVAGGALGGGVAGGALGGAGGGGSAVSSMMSRITGIMSGRN